MKRKFTFKRWFYHWCAYQLTAIKYDCWRFRFLLHDLDKPIVNLFLSNKMTSVLHRKWSRHHFGYRFGKIDYIAMVIDWQCSHLTKDDAPLLAKDTLNTLYKDKIDEETYLKIMAIIERLKL